MLSFRHNLILLQKLTFFQKKEYFSNNEISLDAAFCFSLKLDADVEFSSVQFNTLHVKYPHSDYLSIYAVTLPRQDPSAILTIIIQDPSEFQPLIPHLIWHFPQENKPVKSLHLSSLVIYLAKQEVS